MSKITIRRGVFETNSSSMHSIVIMKDAGKYTEEELRRCMHVGEDGELKWVNTYDLDFGRSPFRCLSGFREKLMYAIASMCSYKKGNDAEETLKYIESVAHEVYPKFKSVKLPHEFWFDDKHKMHEDICYGGVDEDILSTFLDREGVSLKDFLGDRRYVVIVDGDEYCIYYDMKRCGLIDKSNIEKEFPNYEGGN